MKIFKKIYYIWLKIGEILGWIWTRLLLSIIFIFIIGPTSIIMKIFGKDPLKFKFSLNSYWLPRPEKELKEEDYYYQF